MRMLIAEDDAPLASFIAKAFTSQENSSVIATTGEEALGRLEAEKFDILILDLNLPLISGAEVLSNIRANDPELPILILTATDDMENRVACLDAGADDYLTKPFSLSELSARIRALLRRKRATGVAATLRVGDLQLDCVERTVKRGNRAIDLTPREFSLLEYFMRNMGRRVSRTMIITDVWKLAPDTNTNVVDVYVNYLRKKIDEDSKTRLIRTVRRVGYEFGPEPMLSERDISAKTKARARRK